MSGIHLPPGMADVMQQRAMAEAQQAQMIGQHMAIASGIFSRLAPRVIEADTTKLQLAKIDHYAKLSTDAATIFLGLYGVRISLRQPEDTNGST